MNNLNENKEKFQNVQIRRFSTNTDTDMNKRSGHLTPGMNVVVKGPVRTQISTGAEPNSFSF